MERFFAKGTVDLQNTWNSSHAMDNFDMHSVISQKVEEKTRTLTGWRPYRLIEGAELFNSCVAEGGFSEPKRLQKDNDDLWIVLVLRNREIKKLRGRDFRAERKFQTAYSW